MATLNSDLERTGIYWISLCSCLYLKFLPAEEKKSNYTHECFLWFELLFVCVCFTAGSLRFIPESGPWKADITEQESPRGSRHLRREPADLQAEELCLSPSCWEHSQQEPLGDIWVTRVIASSIDTSVSRSHKVGGRKQNKTKKPAVWSLCCFSRVHDQAWCR